MPRGPSRCNRPPPRQLTQTRSRTGMAAGSAAVADLSGSPGRLGESLGEGDGTPSRLVVLLALVVGRPLDQAWPHRRDRGRCREGRLSGGGEVGFEVRVLGRPSSSKLLVALG